MPYEEGLLIATLLLADVIIFYLVWRLDRAERIVRKMAARSGDANGSHNGPHNDQKSGEPLKQI